MRREEEGDLESDEWAGTLGFIASGFWSDAMIYQSVFHVIG